MRTLQLFLTILLLASCSTISYNRQELYNKEISKYKLNDTDTLLDIGCGTGFHDRQLGYLYPKMYFILEDINKNNLNRIRKFNAKSGYSKIISSRFELVLGTVDSIPLKSLSCKKILCRKTLHEFANSSKMINEMKRVLSTDGELIIVENRPKYPGQKFIDCKKEMLDKEQIIKILTVQGFKLKSADSFISEYNDIQDGNVVTFTK